MGNVSGAMEKVTAEKVTVDKRRRVWERVLSWEVVVEIYSSHSSEEEKLRSCADTYVTCKPDPSWEHLVQNLYDYGEMTAAKEAKGFLQQEEGRWFIREGCRVSEKGDHDHYVHTKVLVMTPNQLTVPLVVGDWVNFCRFSEIKCSMLTFELLR